MFHYFYGLMSSFARPVLRVIRIFNTKIDQFLEERSGEASVPGGKRKIWIHCSSLGEFEMAKPIIYELLKTHDIEDILITFFSPSGFRLAKHSRFASACMYLPLDLMPKVRKFYRHYKPEIAIFIRYDLWFNFINYGLGTKVRFYLVNARFRQNHSIFKTLGKPYRKILKKFDRIFCSDEESYHNLKNYKFQNIEFTGDIRFDRVFHNSMEVQSMEDIEVFKGDHKLLVVGSSWPDEELLVKKLLERKPDHLKVIIAPHLVKEERILEIEKTFSDYKVKRYTQKNFDHGDDVLIFNTIGLLSKVYHYADLALVGGGFQGKLHNIIEPAVFGCLISYGPRTNKFPEAREFEIAGFGHRIMDSEEWCSHILHLLNEEEEIKKYREKARDFVRKNLGANDKIMDQLKI